MFDEALYYEDGQQTFFHNVFSSLPAPILVFEEKTLTIVDANDEALNFYGYSREELLQLTMLDISTEAEKTKRSVKKVVDGKLAHIPIRYHQKKTELLSRLRFYRQQ